MTRVDDLNVGDYVAVIGDQIETRTVSSWGSSMEVPVTYDGTPLLVKAISLPFVAVEDWQGQRCNLDIRRYDLQKLTKEYASVYFKEIACSEAGTQDGRVSYEGKAPEGKFYALNPKDGRYHLVCKNSTTAFFAPKKARQEGSRVVEAGFTMSEPPRCIHCRRDMRFAGLDEQNIELWECSVCEKSK